MTGPRYPFSDLPRPWQEEIRALQAQVFTAKAETQALAEKFDAQKAEAPEPRWAKTPAAEFRRKYQSQRQQTANLRSQLRKVKRELAGKETELTRARQSEAAALDRVSELTMRLSEAQLGD